MAKSKSKARGPQRHRGSTTGRYLSAEETGRYTKPVPKDRRHSPRWFGALVVGLLLLGAVLLVGNYLNFLPGAVSPWYLGAGLACILTGFLLATRLR